jgi:hypothetical protein
MNEIYRQGDILLRKIKKLPNNLKPKNKILAYGEVTGHKHQFVDENALVFTNEQNQQYVEVLGEPAMLKHEEHANILIPVGDYEVVNQQEFDPIKAAELEKEKIRERERERRASRRVYD